MDGRDQGGFEEEGGQSSAGMGQRVNATHIHRLHALLVIRQSKSPPPDLIARHTLKCPAMEYFILGCYTFP